MAIRVSDHAVVRWLERVYGLDMDELRARIADVPGLSTAVKLGATRVPVDGLVYCFEENTLVTISPPNTQDRREVRALRQLQRELEDSP